MSINKVFEIKSKKHKPNKNAANKPMKRGKKDIIKTKAEMNTLENENRRIDQYTQEFIPRHDPHKSSDFYKGDGGGKG